MSKILGALAEDVAASYLEKQSFLILAKNYRQFFGEIDIIARKKNLLVFVEVKMRKRNNQLMFELVNKTKQNKIIKTAQHFLSTQQGLLSNNTIRFDVALITCNEKQEMQITYIENAFKI